MKILKYLIWEKLHIRNINYTKIFFFFIYYFSITRFILKIQNCFYVNILDIFIFHLFLKTCKIEKKIQKGGKIMKSEQQYFEEGKQIKEYMDNMSQLKELSFSIYNQFVLPEDGAFIEQLKEANVHILAITEDWCGDAMLNNPVIRKVAEAANVEVRAVLRDEDTDLIDRYLTNGGRAIPIYLVLNEAGEVIAKWGPRAPELQQFVTEMRSALPEKENPSFEEAQKAMYDRMRQQYTENPQMWTNVYEDFKKALLESI